LIDAATGSGNKALSYEAEGLVNSSENRWTIVVIALALVGSSGLALAQAPKSPADTIQFRQQQMKGLGGAFKGVNDELKASPPNLDTIRANAQKMQQLAADLPTWFPAGTGPEVGVKTTAKPEIWTNRPVFEEKAKALQTAVQGLVAVSAGSDVAAIGASIRPIGAACQGCHSEFRVRPAAPPPPPPSPPPAS
jgi:cytochrome c556